MEPPEAMAKMLADKACRRLLNTFAAVPDDKLTWSPSPTSRNALQIVAHTGFSNNSNIKNMLS